MPQPFSFLRRSSERASGEYTSVPYTPESKADEFSSSSSTDDNISPSPLPSSSRRWTSQFLISSNFLVILITSALIYAGAQIRYAAFPSLAPTSGALSIMHSPCGSSPEEARAAGCNFDAMSFSWLPDECYDPDLTAQFMALGDDPVRDWEYWMEWNSTEPVPREEALSGKHEKLYVSWEFHLYHCTYMWRKLHRAILQGKRVDSYIGNMGHTTHCERMLIEATGGIPDETKRGGIKLMEQPGGTRKRLLTRNTMINSKWPDCGTVVVGGADSIVEVSVDGPGGQTGGQIGPQVEEHHEH